MGSPIVDEHLHHRPSGERYIHVWLFFLLRYLITHGYIFFSYEYFDKISEMCSNVYVPTAYTGTAIVPSTQIPIVMSLCLTAQSKPYTNHHSRSHGHARSCPSREGKELEILDKIFQNVVGTAPRRMVSLRTPKETRTRYKLTSQIPHRTGLSI